jgi:hypothetical protein
MHYCWDEPKHSSKSEYDPILQIIKSLRDRLQYCTAFASETQSRALLLTEPSRPSRLRLFWPANSGANSSVSMYLQAVICDDDWSSDYGRSLARTVPFQMY